MSKMTIVSLSGIVDGCGHRIPCQKPWCSWPLPGVEKCMQLAVVVVTPGSH